jgi:flavin reductase (DIM6/NTAB) family NADH-FMN oxidoreductase RutF
MSGKLAPLFKMLTHGVYVIGVAGDGRPNAFTAAWVMQVSFDPLMFALSINRRHSSYALLRAGGGFTVNVLRRGQENLAMHFGKPASADKLAQVAWHESQRGAPLLDDALAWFECEFVRECPAGDHLVVIGRVVDGALLAADAEPMNYRDTGDMDGSAALFPDGFGGA